MSLKGRWSPRVSPGGVEGQLLRVKVPLKRWCASRVGPGGERLRVVEGREGTARQALGRLGSAERRGHTGKTDGNCTSILCMATSSSRERGGATRGLTQRPEGENRASESTTLAVTVVGPVFRQLRLKSFCCSSRTLGNYTGDPSQCQVLLSLRSVGSTIPVGSASTLPPDQLSIGRPLFTSVLSPCPILYLWVTMIDNSPGFFNEDRPPPYQHVLQNPKPL